MTPVLQRQAAALAAHLRGVATKLAKVDHGDLVALEEALAAHPYDADLRAQLEQALAALYADQQMRELRQLAAEAALSTDALDEMLAQVNERSVAWARSRVGNLVTEVSDATRDRINQMVADAVEGGQTNDELASAFEDAYAFSRERGLVIARTETNNAESQGTLAGYRASGVVSGKYWAADADACEVCEANAAAGHVGLEESFPSGDDGPPAHPNCECSLGAVIAPGILAA